jgi:tetratricopeptide (TPR) repeat protein
MKYLVAVLLVGGAIGAAIALNRPRPDLRPAETPRRASACEVALAPGSQQGDIDRAIRQLQDRAREPRHAREALEQLGYHFVARARAANDPGDYVLAEKTAECLEELHPGDAGALLLRGHTLHQRHRFADAEAIARRLVSTREYVLDYGLLGDTLMDQGRLSEAAAAYQKMIDLKPFYQSYTRAAHLRWIRGDVDGAIELVHKAIDAAGSRDRESIAWAYTRLATYELQRGRLEDAERATGAALSFEPEYAAALLAHGRVLLATGRPVDAVDALKRAANLNPLPEYQWALADALRRSGLGSDASSIEQQLIARGAAVDPRTLALFLATRRIEPARALELTERELEVRADIFTHDARAWALAAAGRLDDARISIRRALAEHTKDARLFLHAGVIAARAGQRAEARRWFARADALHATLLPSELDLLHQPRIHTDTHGLERKPR